MISWLSALGLIHFLTANWLMLELVCGLPFAMLIKLPFHVKYAAAFTDETYQTLQKTLEIRVVELGNTLLQPRGGLYSRL